ncbi:IMPACT family protein [Cognatitamlana onchidii]|uniref:IMPACT family protein n=1 Tax=Cognatitamlana onchidii TaxID=2562860 RepID=UPI0010A682B3|nr:YigZ family protein [Algibacter onchidii]
MSQLKDTYKTIITAPAPVLFKDKNSKFFGYAFPVNTEHDVKTHLTKLKKEHHAARHWCYAYQLGTEQIFYRTNDDGEPSNSAGAPIYGQIQSFQLTNVLVIIVRYFGGVKLGVSGLINAYKTAAQMVLEQSLIVEKTIDVNFIISFDYKHMNTVMRLIKEKQITISNQELEMACKIYISVRKNDSQNIFELFDRVYEVDIKKVN